MKLAKGLVIVSAMTLTLASAVLPFQAGTGGIFGDAAISASAAAQGPTVTVNGIVYELGKTPKGAGFLYKARVIGCSLKQGTARIADTVQYGGMKFYVSSIVKGAFAGSGITGIDMTSAVSMSLIEDGAFQNCLALKEVAFPDEMSEFSYDMFVNCPSIERFSVSPNNAFFWAQKGILYNYDRNELIAYPCGKTDAVFSASRSVDSVAAGAFRNAGFLKKVDFSASDSVVVAETAFADCDALTQLVTADEDDDAETIFENYRGMFLHTDITTVNGTKLYSAAEDNLTEPQIAAEFSDAVCRNFGKEYVDFRFIAQFVDAYADYVVATELHADDNEFRRAVKLHDWVIARADSAVILGPEMESDRRNHVDASIFLKYAEGGYYSVCDGFSRAYAILMKKAGVECYYVSGTDKAFIGKNQAVGSHAWNLAKINGNFYHIDVYWDNNASADDENPSYFHFMGSDEEFDASHKYSWSASEDSSLKRGAGIAMYSLNNLGDVNLDGEVTWRDAKLIGEYISKNAELNAEQLVYADVDFDGEVTTSDAVFIISYWTAAAQGDVTMNGRIDADDAAKARDYVQGRQSDLTYSQVDRIDMDLDEALTMYDVGEIIKSEGQIMNNATFKNYVVAYQKDPEKFAEAEALTKKIFASYFGADEGELILSELMDEPESQTEAEIADASAEAEETAEEIPTVTLPSETDAPETAETTETTVVTETTEMTEPESEETLVTEETKAVTEETLADESAEEEAPAPEREEEEPPAEEEHRGLLERIFPHR